MEKEREADKTQYAYGYCGMPCALCTRYRTAGTSRCPGCSHDGYYTESCKAHHCCKEKGLRHCGECGGFPCVKLGKMGDFRDLDTGHAKARVSGAVAAHGFAAWYRDYAKRADMLTLALARYNNGRMKRYLCELFLKTDTQSLETLMRRAQSLSGDPKEIGKAFQALAEEIR